MTRYELDNLQGLNFLLEQALGGGGTTSLLVDPQGKTMSQALLEMKVKVPGVPVARAEIGTRGLTNGEYHGCRPGNFPVEIGPRVRRTMFRITTV